jgi:hypothetical protein
MNSDYCNCNEFEKAVDYNDIRSYRLEDDRFNAVKKAGWHIRPWAYNGPFARLELFKYYLWRTKKSARP